MDKIPNTFFVGFSKCGTTSMASWLDTHPDIYVSKPKEPDFFQKKDESGFPSYEKYLKVCFGSNNRHKVTVDASVACIFSEGCIKRIVNFNPDAKFLVMVRNPVDASYSLYSHFVKKGQEDAKTFSEAWELQEERAKGMKLPDNAPDHFKKLQYGNIYKFGEKIERLYRYVEPKRVHIINLSDVKKNPKKEYKKALSFLEVPHIINTDFSKFNQDARKKSMMFEKLLDYVGKIKHSIGISYLNTGIFKKLRRLNTFKHQRKPLSAQFRKEVKDHFTSDAKKLEKLTKIKVLNFD